MGIAEIDAKQKLINIYATIICYGDAASDSLCSLIANDIQTYWNAPGGVAKIKRDLFRVSFYITGEYDDKLQPATIYENDNPAINYFRIEEFSNIDISFVDGLGSNTGYFKMANLLDHSTTAAHEFGHTLGLPHPVDIDIRGKQAPGIMYPRGTITDPCFQYDPAAAPGSKGGTLNPVYRRVLQQDIDDLQLNKIKFDKDGLAVIGSFSSVWHDRH